MKTSAYVIWGMAMQTLVDGLNPNESAQYHVVKFAVLTVIALGIVALEKVGTRKETR